MFEGFAGSLPVQNELVRSPVIRIALAAFNEIMCRNQ